MYEKLSGEIDIINLIKNIKKINNEIILFFILENKNEEFENLLKQENIKYIFYNNEINIDELILKLKNIKINNQFNLEEEIKLLKNIINKKDEQLLKYQNLSFNQNNSKKIITVIGRKNAGKSLILSNLKNVIKERSDIEFKEINITDFLEIEKINNITYKFIFVFECDLEKIINNKTIIDKLILENKIDLKKINIIFNKINKYSINYKIAKNIFKKFKIIGKIKLNNYSNFLLNESNNYQNENIKLERRYLKIIKKINL